MIKRLDSISVLNLCVNQVIIDLATCVKELVENSLDAGSTKIEVLLREYGKEGIEVNDNGVGINQENLENIAQKGATSKLREFNDLENLSSFGFRGEALNAICVLSQLTITSKTENDQMGYKYVFNSDNSIKQKQSVARERGTTVSLRDLFGSFPVRKQEFNRNIISQFNKLVNLLTEYTLISTSCQICIVNFTAKKGREMILNSGQPTKSIFEKAVNVFTKKITSMLIELNFEFKENSKVVEGYVLKKIESGSVNETKNIPKNLTYLYVNGRPINPLKKVTSVFNEIYKKYNSSAKHMYILHLIVSKDSVDFNMSPDKRDVCLKYEVEFINSLRDSLTSLFELIGGQMKVLQLSSKNNKRMNDAENSEGDEGNEQKRSSSIQMEDFVLKEDSKMKGIELNNLSKIEEENQVSVFGEQSYNAFQGHLPSSAQIEQLKMKILQIEQPNVNQSSNKNKILVPLTPLPVPPVKPLKGGGSNSILQIALSNTFNGSALKPSVQNKSIQQNSLFDEFSFRPAFQNESIKDTNKLLVRDSVKTNNDHNNKLSSKSLFFETDNLENIRKVFQQRNDREGGGRLFESNEAEEDDKDNLSKKGESRYKPMTNNIWECIDKVEFDLSSEKSNDLVLQKDKFENQYSNLAPSFKHEEVQGEQEEADQKQKDYQDEKISFEDLDDFVAEEVGCKEKKNIHGIDFKKEKFEELIVLGQFNKAFILAYWIDQNEIFLIDQHASDEKANFEKLLKENVFQSQSLIKPIEIPLTIQEADILEAHREVFRMNGFSFVIKTYRSDLKAEDGRLLQVSQLPASKHIQFDINDFDEIFTNLCSEEVDPATFRPKKIQKILASKACRQSIMVGKDLAPVQMKQVLNKLTNLKSPWNCPHGRPTMVKTPTFSNLTAQISVKKIYSL